MMMHHTNPKNFVDLLEVFRLCLVNGIIDRKIIISWADKIIQEQAVPDYFVIELAMCGSKTLNDMISLLNEYVGGNKSLVPGRVTLGHTYHEYSAQRIDLNKVVQTLDWLVWKSIFTEPEKGFMYGVDDEYHLAVEGFRESLDDIERHVVYFISIYEGFHLDNTQEWNAINSTIDSKVNILLRRAQNGYN